MIIAGKHTLHHRSISKAVTFGLVILFGLFSSIAGAAQIKGAAKVEYRGLKVSKDVRREAFSKAQLNAIERYISATSQSKVQIFETKRTVIESSLDRLLLDTRIVKDERDKKFKTYRVIISGELDTLYLDQLLGDSGKPIGAGEYLTFIFIAREQASIQSFDDRRVARKKNTQQLDSRDQQHNSDAGMSHMAEKIQVQQMEVGGSTTRRADDIAYRVSSAQQINIAMSSSFTEAGFEVVEAALLENETAGQVSVDAFKRDYEHGELAPATLNSAIAGLRDLEIPFFAIGTLDASLASVDGVTGTPKVTVTVTAQIKSLKRRFPKTIASVGPIVFTANGANATAARSNALKLAAEQAASKLIAQLQARGIN